MDGITTESQTEHSKLKSQIVELHEQIKGSNVDSDSYDTLIGEMYALLQQRMLLEELMANLEDRNQAIETISEPQSQKKRREHKTNNFELFKDKFVENSVELSCSIAGFSTDTTELVAEFMQTYADDFPVVPARNFFHAAACSNFNAYTSSEFKNEYEELSNVLWTHAGCPMGTGFPLTLSAVERIIHMPRYCKYHVSILDTSLQVILTNAGYSNKQRYSFLVIFDSCTRKFAPISQMNRKGQYFCNKCFRYPKTRSHSDSCQRQCPICLRSGDDVKCFKLLSDFKFQICPACNAYCYRDDCFNAHQTVCPRPVSELHDDIVQQIINLDFSI